MNCLFQDPSAPEGLLHSLAQNTPLPTNIVVHQRSRELGVDFSDGFSFRFSFEFLRVSSPSAEVQGHSPDQAVLQYGKREVLITEIEQVGNYAIRPVFSDGHGSGIYFWDYLYQLGKDQDVLLEKFELEVSTKKEQDFSHSYFQGLLIEIGNLKRYHTYAFERSSRIRNAPQN